MVGFNMPSCMSCDLAPPNAKNFLLSISKISPRIKCNTESLILE